MPYALVWRNLNTDSVYLIDTFPVSACDTIRIPRSRIYKGEEYRGYNASKRRYFYGLKVHMICTGRGEPAEVFFTPGSINDTEGLRLFNFNLPENSTVYGDKSYNNYEIALIFFQLRSNISSIRIEQPWSF